ncbi:HD-GYP domain-containing protein [Halioxenophilus sp. WMMB6]|uniref:HD-GYP domain-containing protein n=1 Tax=Halioxenophilus sp. WMMB6 TaxID=3073815 RepID=UPI00295E4989|nr:HD-GYP domain-containing protein [Halioxenophilus sp. WMMB6]
MTNIVRIPVSALEVGMYITDINNAWVPDNNLSRKGLIKNAKVIEQIIKLGVTEVYIDQGRGKAAEVGLSLSDINRRQAEQLQALVARPYERPSAKSVFDQALVEAKKIQSEATELVSKVMMDAKLGLPLDFGPAQETADAILESLKSNQNALLCVTQLRTKDRYLLEHSFNVSVLMGVLASSLGFHGRELQALVSGALLHDVGKIRVHDNILHKPGGLTPEEWEEMKRHVTYGEEFLCQDDSLAPEIIEICAQHHERLDGSGYPRGLSAEQLPLHTRMASVADVYDAVTADRVYHQGMAPTTALKKMLEWSDAQQLDKNLVYQFIRCVGVYPPGAVVLLSNHRLAVVVSEHPSLMDKPVVKVVYHLDQRLLLPPYPLDLSEHACEVTITRAVDPRQYGLEALTLLNAAL